MQLPINLTSLSQYHLLNYILYDRIHEIDLFFAFQSIRTFIAVYLFVGSILVSFFMNVA